MSRLMAARFAGQRRIVVDHLAGITGAGCGACGAAGGAPVMASRGGVPHPLTAR